MRALIDRYNRKIDYIRISVTDRCDLRCIYCIPKDTNIHSERMELLQFEEIYRIARCFARLGVNHVRITGGEPLLRRGIVSLVKQLSSIEGIDDIAMTTNATMLSQYAIDLKRAGLKRVNISIDTLKPETFRIISRGGNLEDVLSGIRKAIDAGLAPVNLNTVVMKGLNDGELIDIINFAIENRVNIRFIECMPVNRYSNLEREMFIPAKEIKHKIEKHFKLETVPSFGGGPASYFRIKGSPAKIGLITPITQHFCESCNRVRLTAEGVLKLCLGHNDRIDLRGYIRSGASDDDLQDIIIGAIQNKPPGHNFSSGKRIPIEKPMSMIGG
jgi:cyclic pyranopterin phosphate synthase